MERKKKNRKFLKFFMSLLYHSESTLGSISKLLTAACRRQLTDGISAVYRRYSYGGKSVIILAEMKFSELNLHPDLQRGINEAGYLTCMPVQEEVLKNAFSGHDLYVQSQTGTGKTAAFLIVIFQRLLTEDMLHGKKAIIMVPTRELAVQVEEEAKLLSKYLPFKTGSFYGGVGYTQQTAFLKNNVQIMVGTPGRVLDLNKSGQMNLMDIAFLVLDEADRMFDMGFYPDLRKLIRAVPPADKRQTMLFSATLNAWVKNLAWEYTKNPYEIAIEPETVTVEEVEQILYHVSSGDKIKLLLGILQKENPESAIIFCNTKRYAEIVAKRLRMNSLECEFIMGDLPQKKRLKIIDDIKAGKLRLLVATDVAARGLDIIDLAMVINFDLPNETENYVHRIGRTARAGKTGKAVTIASEQDVYQLPAIERYIGVKIPAENATKELFADDKSEGKRVRTDFYEEPGSGKRQHEGRRGAEEKRDRKSRDEKDTGRGRRRSEKSHSDNNRNDSNRTQNADVKLSELSLEERMAYYRQKYDKSGASQSGTGQRVKGKKETRSKEPKTKDPKAKKTESKEAKPGKRERSSTRGRGKPASRRNEKAESQIQASISSPASDQKTEKKSLLSKVLGLFRKKQTTE